VFDLVEETTNLVERTHDAVVERSARRFAPIEPAKTTAKVVTTIQTAITGGVLESIRVINGITRFTVNSIADVAVADRELATPIRSTAAGTSSWYVDHLQSSLNGFWGDYLSGRKNPLDLGMSLRHHGRHRPVTPEALATAFPNPTNKVCVFVHSLATTLAATVPRDPDHPLGRLLGDLVVRLPSASGEAHEPARRIRCSSVAVFSGMNHLDIANHPDVYEALRDLMAASAGRCGVSPDPSSRCRTRWCSE